MNPTQTAASLRHSLTPNWSTQGPYQWGKVAATHTSPNTVDVYMDGAAVVTLGVRYLDGYSPTVGDIVLIGRMQGRSRTARWVFGKLA